MKQTTLFLRLAFLLLSTICSASLIAQLDLELRLEAEKLALTEGQQGKFTFIVDNVGAVDASDVVVVFRFPEVEFVGMDATSSAYFETIKAGESASFEVELISRVPFLRFYAEIVNGSGGDIDSGELNIDRCRALAACADGGDNCIYDLCMLEDDEVIYPMSVDLEVLTVSCPPEFPMQDENLTYELSIRNNASTASSPTVLGLFQYPQAVYTAMDPAPHKQSEATIPSIAAGTTETVTLVYTYNPFQEDDFNYAGGTAFSFASDGSSRDVEVDIACQKITTDVVIAMIGEPATFGDDEIMRYRVEVTNNGNEVARALRVQYANEMNGFQNAFSGQVLSVETTFVGSTFFQRNNLNAGTSDRFWDIGRLEVGETAILNVSYQIAGDIVEQFIDSYSISVGVFSDFLSDTNEENNSASVEFNRGTAVTTNVTLSLEAEKSALLEGEQGTFTFTLENTTAAAVEDLAISFTLNKDFDILEETVSTSKGDFSGGWLIQSLGVGESATLSFEATSSGYANFIAEVVSMGELLISRCITNDCYPNDNLRCFYTNCTAETDEVLYPAEYATVSFQSVSCASGGPVGCSAKYDIVFENNTDVASAPLNLFLRARIGDGPSFYEQGGSTLQVPSIPPNSSLEYTADFDPCLESRPFAGVSERTLGLTQSDEISFFLSGNAAPLSLLDNSIGVDECITNNTSDIAVRAESNGIIGTDNKGTYQVFVTNNGNTTVEFIQITYGMNVRGGSGEFYISYEGTSDYPDSYFSIDEENANRFIDYASYWNIPNLAPGETAVMNASISVKEMIDNITTVLGS